MCTVEKKSVLGEVIIKKRKKNLSSHKNIHKKVHSSIIHRSLKKKEPVQCLSIMNGERNVVSNRKKLKPLYLSNKKLIVQRIRIYS